jgi:hypothetical protein
MIQITKEKFIEEFHNANSMKELKQNLKCSDWTIQDRMKKYSISKKEINKEIILTEEQKDVIIGALLGDGGIYSGKRCKNSYFSYISSQKEHVDYIYSFLKNSMTERYKDGPVKSERFDSRTNKTYISYSIRTENNLCFEKIRKEWYKDKKIIPSDLILNPLICKIWYLGDGGILKNKNSVASNYIKLSTDGFEPKYVISVIKKLNKFDARIQFRNKEKTQFAILIPRYKIKDFLAYIGECPIECYKYKWNYIPCKSDKIEINGISNIQIYEEEIINDYINGNKVSFLSDKYKCDQSLIRYHLKKNNIQIKSEKSKYRISYENGNILEPENLEKFCKDNNINYTQIYRYIKSGKKYKDFLIKKI